MCNSQLWLEHLKFKAISSADRDAVTTLVVFLHVLPKSRSIKSLFRCKFYSIIPVS